MLTGDAVETGKHTLEIKQKGDRPGLLQRLPDQLHAGGLHHQGRPGSEGQPQVLQADAGGQEDQGARLARPGRSIRRSRSTSARSWPTWPQLKSGDLVEVELEIDSKNDYEYLIFEDSKAAGFEPMLVRSGYNANDMGAYMELRDERVCFFVRALARGKHSVSYRLRAEIPGKFSALPTRASAMYAPELKGNSDEIKLLIRD